MHSPATLATLLGTDMDVTSQMHWAVCLAQARKLDLLILHRVEDRDERSVEVTLGMPAARGASEVAIALTDLIEASPGLRAGAREQRETHAVGQPTDQHIVHVRFKIIYFTSLTSLRRGILSELRNQNVKLYTQALANINDPSDVDLVRERRLFLRYIPCELVLCLGLEKDRELTRILVATTPGPNGRAALKLGLALSTSIHGTLTALQVNPNVGVDAEKVGERRLSRLLRESLGSDPPAVNRLVNVDGSIQHGIRQVWNEGNHDVIVLGAPVSQIDRSTRSKFGKGVTMVIVSSASPLANRLKELIEEGIRRTVPQIDREDRIALVDRVQSSAAWNFDFLTLMVLSTIMAAIGLVQNSAAVVIGAMLVAPLMTPLLGLGLALVQGNPVLGSLSLRSVALGVCVSLLGGFLVGFATPSFEEPTREMLARSSAGLLDLCVAAAAGLAVAYASSRPGLIAALPGVAIAAALVPPIATSGLALSLGDLPLAIGALLLFGINMFTIVLASMTSLWVVGIRNLRNTSVWSKMATGVVMVGVLGLGIFLSIKPQEYELADELPAGLADTVQEAVGAKYRFESLAVAYDELGAQLNLQVVGKVPVSEEMATLVRTLVSDFYDQPVRVRLLTRIAADR